MSISISNNFDKNLNFKLSTVKQENVEIYNIAPHNKKMIIAEKGVNILEIWEGEFPHDKKQFYEVNSPAELIIKNTDEIFLIENNRNLKRLNSKSENNYFDSNLIYVLNMRENKIFLRIDKSENLENIAFNEIKSGEYFSCKRKLNQYYIMQVADEKKEINYMNFIVKASFEYIIDHRMNVISNLNGNCYYTKRNWGDSIDSNDVLCIILNYNIIYLINNKNFEFS